MNGEFCDPSTTTVSPGSGLNCTRTSYGYSNQGSATVNKWLCDSQDDLNNLLAGPLGGSSSGNKQIYVNKNDIVCVADDPTTNMYYCQSVADATAQKPDTERDDLSATCDALLGAYLDLSNNIAILSSAQANATNAASQSRAISNTLQTLFSSVCPANNRSPNPNYCAGLSKSISDLNANISAGSSSINAVLSPVNVAIQSRDALKIQLDFFKCKNS